MKRTRPMGVETFGTCRAAESSFEQSARPPHRNF